MLNPRAVKWLVPIIFILLIYFSINYLIIEPIKETNLPENFSKMKSSIREEEWDDANYYMKEINEQWDRVKMKIFINAGVDSVRDFEDSLARLETAVQEKESLPALMELSTVEVIWEEFITF